MNTQEYIDSGLLELYVAGVLSEEQNKEIHQLITQHPAIKKEVKEIEKTIQKMTEALAPNQKVSFDTIKTNIKANSGTTRIDMTSQKTKKINWRSYSGWAAAILLGSGMIYNYYQNNLTQAKNEQLRHQVSEANEYTSEIIGLVRLLRNKDVANIKLSGQKISPDAYAKVFWNKVEQTAYIDVAGLPDPPKGMVYQVWSLKLDPLTPTSLGVLSDFRKNNSKMFLLENTNESEAFGITLEPEGGSETPTLEQLYVLGTAS